MGSFSGYSSPKTSYESSHSVPSTPKSSSYESSKVSSVPSQSISNTPITIGTGYRNNIKGNDISGESLSSKSDLNSFRDLITSYLGVIEKIEYATATLSSLQQQKTELEAKMTSNSEFEKFSTMLASINDSKGPKR